LELKKLISENQNELKIGSEIKKKINSKNDKINELK